MKKTVKKEPVSGAEMLAAMPRSPRDVMEQNGLGMEYLVGLLKKELGAKDTYEKTHKDGTVTKSHHPIWPIRQKARQDAHKLRGDYPADRLEVSGLEETLQRLGQDELDKRIRLLDREAAALRTEMGEGSETVEP